MRLIDGRGAAAAIRTDLAGRAATLREAGTTARLAVLCPVADAGARSYVRGLEKAAASTGVDAGVIEVDDAATTAGVVSVIDALAADDGVHGILVQMPLPSGVDREAVLAALPAHKDVDGAGPAAAGRLLLGISAPVPATAAAVMAAVELAGAELKGAHAVVVGRSAVSGKPAALLLLAADATVTICHTKTRDLHAICREADVLVVAAGRARLIGAGHIKPGAVVIDVGINADGDGIAGDVDHDAVAGLPGAITPVPGGIGPLTTAMLLRAVIEAAESTRPQAHGPDAAGEPASAGKL